MCRAFKAVPDGEPSGISWGCFDEDVRISLAVEGAERGIELARVLAGFSLQRGNVDTRVYARRWRAETKHSHPVALLRKRNHRVPERVASERG